MYVFLQFEMRFSGWKLGINLQMVSYYVIYIIEKKNTFDFEDGILGVLLLVGIIHLKLILYLLWVDEVNVWLTVKR